MEAADLLERIGVEGEQFLEARQRELYLSGSGLKPAPELAGLYRRHAGLFSADSVLSLPQIAAEADPEARSWAHLRTFLVREHIQAGLAEIEEALERAAGEAAVEISGERIPYRALQGIIAAEEDRGRRREYDEAKREADAHLNLLREQRLRVMHARAGDLGHTYYEGVLRRLMASRLDTLHELMGTLLERTEAAYAQLLEDALERMGIDLAHAEHSDLLHAFQALDLAGHFRRFAQLSTLSETLRLLGTPLDGMPNLRVDREERAGKVAGCFCVPVRVPGEVYLVINPPRSGHDHRGLLSAAGRALYYASIDPALPFALRSLGDKALAEVYAFLLPHLRSSPEWLKRFTGVSGHALYEYLDLARFHELYVLRSLATRVLFEDDLFETPAGAGTDLPREYANRMSRALGVRYFPESYLAHAPDGFTSAEQAAGAIVGAALYRRLRQEFGPNWFEQEDAGRFLLSICARGHTIDAEDLAEELGSETLDVEPLLADLLSDSLED